MQELKGAFTLLDVAMKLYKGLDQGNLLKYKVLSLLGSLLETQKDSEAVKKVNDTIFKQLEGVHCYEKVFALRNYGYILAAKEETRFEGQDFIKKAEELETQFPFWSERQMNLFVPIMSAIDKF
mmetsp:Transcript_15660/g.11395  ORF Transcript_15660/g.11395 Transcript_15660/m.11395 type:complete len:124 (+) Transcript_15660:203-574(+)